MGKSFSQFDLTNLQDGVEGVGRAILQRKLMEQAAADRETKQAQQMIENKQRDRSLDISEQGQKNTDAYHTGVLQNQQAAAAQKGVDAQAKAKADLEKARLTAEYRTAVLQRGTEQDKQKVKTDFFNEMNDGAKLLQQALDNGADPEFVRQKAQEGWDNTSPELKALTESSPIHSTFLKTVLSGQLKGKPKPELNIRDLPPKPGESQAVTFGNNLRVIPPADANPTIEVTSHEGLTDTKQKFTPEKFKIHQDEEQQRRIRQTPGWKPSPAYLERTQTPPAQPARQPLPPATSLNQAQGNSDLQGALDRANQAISNGADPAQVKARFKQLYGIDL